MEKVLPKPKDVQILCRWTILNLELAWWCVHLSQQKPHLTLSKTKFIWLNRWVQVWLLFVWNKNLHPHRRIRFATPGLSNVCIFILSISSQFAHCQFSLTSSPLLNNSYQFGRLRATACFFLDMQLCQCIYSCNITGHPNTLGEKRSRKWLRLTGDSWESTAFLPTQWTVWHIYG